MKRTWLFAIGAGAAIAVLGVGAVWAQSSGQGATGSSFLDRVAQKLGIESPKLQQAITDTRNEDIDAAVARGALTQKQADAMKQRGAAGGPGIFGGPGTYGGPGRGGRGMMGPKGFGFGGAGFGFALGLPEQEQKFADFLGISTDQLRTELRADKATLASVAEAHGKSRDDLKSFITGALKAKLDEAVSNGGITQARADEIMAKVNDNLDKLIDGSFVGHLLDHFEFRGHRDGGGQDDPNGSEPERGSTQSGSQF